MQSNAWSRSLRKILDTSLILDFTAAQSQLAGETHHGTMRSEMEFAKRTDLGPSAVAECWWRILDMGFHRKLRHPKKASGAVEAQT
jgi:hypothetical protein